ncbi:uncharacterized protein Tco025E_00161 [Trypanosoma conorhini]|uniref:Uncharacterized protein n=1 Tax=Trypanosoma conorhini TaxID=83891 RepID=A0A3R7NV77_9TRYP|nr:uncharacterized protein Tco025E_00161 [Trypanosoma conorhini]RNF27600.1 hypothetical protein Tco025E_00161 [Trypanosoma conorhini]
MPPPPPAKASTATAHGATLLNGKNTTAGTTAAAARVAQERRRPSVPSSAPPRPVEAPAREAEEENARRRGRTFQRRVLQPSKSATSDAKTEQVPRPLPLPSRTPATVLPGAAAKTTAVTSTSTNRVQPVPSPQPQALPASIFDDVPVQASLEYLTRPHRSWDSAVRIRERAGRRQQRESARRAWRGSSSLSTSVASSASVSCASVNRAMSPSSLSVRSAPPTFGHAHASVSPGGTQGSGTRRRGRFGVLPSLQPDPGGLAVGGSSLSVSLAPSALPRLRPVSPGQTSSPATRNPFVLAPAERRGANTPALAKVREFSFTMQ